MRVFVIEDKSFQKYFDLFKDRKTGEMDIRCFPGVINGIQRATNYVKKEWIETLNAQQEKKGWCREYAKTIETELQNNGMVGIVEADDKNMYVNFVEKGIPRFDMKKGLLSGKNAAKHGGKFAIVPFQRGTPSAQHLSAMPIRIYEQVKKIDKRDIARRYRTIGIGANLNASTKKRIHSKGFGLKRASKKSIYEGMLKVGSVGHTSYMTFRIVSKKSIGWIYPGSIPIKIFDTVEKKVEPYVKKFMEEGLKSDTDAGLQYLERG